MQVIKKNRLLYYFSGFLRPFLPTLPGLEKKINSLHKTLSKKELEPVEFRVNYYCNFSGEPAPIYNKVQDLRFPVSPKSYFFDTYEYARYFDKDLGINYVFGDVNTILPYPAITKSRPVISGANNNVLLKLDKVRHFVSVKDTIPFSEKRDILFGRAHVSQAHRILFYERYFGQPMCDLGQVNLDGGNREWIKQKVSISEHLGFKFILSLEGNDVATNLKWIMSSNSIAVAPVMKMESWYMEGLLQPDIHYISVNDDYTDVISKLQFYIDHPKMAQEIIGNAQAYRMQFENQARESLISLLVLQKYLSAIQST